MNENELTRLPASPQPMRPAFAQELQTKLQHVDIEPAQSRIGAPRARWRLAAAGAAAVAVVATLILSPAARAAADRFLNLFRVQHITALAIDPARIEELRKGGLTHAGVESLIGDALVEDAQAIKEGTKPRQVVNAAEAANATGLSLRVPALGDPSALTFYVQDAQTLHFQGNVARLNALVQALGITDVALPAQLEGAIVTVTKPAAVMVSFDRDNEHWTLLQSHSPSVELPDGVNLAQLGELGLRVVGIAPDEAHRIAQTTDWNSTLLVPIPTNVGSFRNVTLNNGASGLLVTTGGTGASSVRGSNGERQRSSLIWVENDMVYALTGGFSANVVDVANSLR